MDKTQYKGILVFAEQREGVIQNVAFELIGKARELADQINEQVLSLIHISSYEVYDWKHLPWSHTGCTL